MTKPHIAFVCRYNRGRSPIAAVVLSEQLRRRGLADAVRVTSAGTCPTPGTGLDPLAAQVLLARGYPVPAHRATPVGDDHLGADLVVALGFEHVGNLQRRGVDDDRIRYVEVRNPCRQQDFEVAFDRISDAMPQLHAWVDDRIGSQGRPGIAVAWRFWLVRPGTDVLAAPYQSGVPWVSSRYQAICTADRRHVPPHPNCWCGVYADVTGPAGVCMRAVGHQPSEWGGITDTSTAVVVGRVALEGAVSCNPKFCTTPELRASAATIQELWVMPVRRAPDSGRLVGPLRDRYRVPVHFGVPTQLVADARRPSRDGSGWVLADNGVRYWGRFGAAGLLLWAPRPDGAYAILLQHRAGWSDHGGTWGLPGGARDSDETAEKTALREAREETGVAVDQLRVRATVVTARAAGAEWTYTTVVADAERLLPVRPNAESREVRWVDEADVAALPLHPGFAASWPALRTLRFT